MSKPNFQAKKKLNILDFLFQDGWFETKVKKPKQLVMQQFQISDCEQCNIFLLDSNACVYVDSCKYCNIFIGPSQSSIFIRDCEGLNVISISQQFRVRDSFNCKFAIFCQSQPIIQSSHSLTFTCYPKEFTYKLLGEQMKQAKLTQWNNNWFDIYDFTPKKFNRQNHQLSCYQKQFVAMKQLFMQQLKQLSVQNTSRPMLPAIEGKVNLQTLSFYSMDQIIFLVINPSIEPHQALGLILQSRYVPVVKQVEEIIKINGEKNKKVLFLKINKQDQSRWRQCQMVIKVVKNQKDKQLIESIVFAPFKDQH